MSGSVSQSCVERRERNLNNTASGELGNTIIAFLTDTPTYI